eukprot:TRINITY_DN8468_c0_g2_i1.p1 TRINITY_DN8468_c0_g2~~TRINITY_DN8468_c0_g2_i1.p1  ORF type:complete len:520 (+),score=26.29 TRINITY_DN8468_c0_g2_i1:61-1620(+)
MDDSFEERLLADASIEQQNGRRSRACSVARLVLVATFACAGCLLIGLVGRTEKESTDKFPSYDSHTLNSDHIDDLDETDACGPPLRPLGKVGWVRIMGGPPAPTPDFSWIARVCTPLYPGPKCSNSSSWQGIVTLCVDGKPIQGVLMKTRGHVSKMFPKMQFSIKLPHALGLLGMAPARSWVLGTSFIDTSFQRNPLAFDLYKKLGGWATETRYVNLDWHGLHLGLYYIGERIQRAPGKIDVPPSIPSEPRKSGYLVTVDWPKPGKDFVTTTNTSTVFNFIYPKKVSTEQKVFVQGLLDNIDVSAAMKQDNIAKFIDIPSFVTFFMVEELAKDLDGYAFSNYMTIEHGKLVHAAPWDFDLAFGFDCQSRYFTNNLTGEDTTGTVTGWNVENTRDSAYWIGPTGLPQGAIWEFGSNKRRLFSNIWQDVAFRRAFAIAWKQARLGPISDVSLRTSVMSRSALIAEGAQQDMAIWHKTNRCGFWKCCEPEGAQSFDVATSYLLEFLLGRARWIDSNVDSIPK